MCQIVKYINSNGLEDLKLVKCTKCAHIWARMYDIETNSPIFSDQSGKIAHNIQNISQERRINYDWYVENGNIALENYKLGKSDD